MSEQEIKNDAFIHNINFVKFDGKVLLVWAIIAPILFYFSKDFYNISLSYLILFLISGLLLGLGLKYLLLIDANKKDNLNIYEIGFNLIFIYNAITIVFALFLTIILFKLQVIALIYPIWLFSIAVPRFIIGNMSNCGSCRSSATAFILAALIMLMFISVFPEYVNSELTVNIFSHVSSALLFLVFLLLGRFKINKHKKATSNN